MIWYLIGINIVSFFLYGLDKHNARKNIYRVSEYSLLILSFFGGCVGSLIGMRVFHHKTKKIKFWILNILFTIMWIFIICKLMQPKGQLIYIEKGL